MRQPWTDRDERAERRAAPKHVLSPVEGPARAPSGAEPGHLQSSGLWVPGEGPGHRDRRGLQGRPTYSPGGGQS